MIKILKEVVGFLMTLFGILILLPFNVLLSIIHTFSASSNILFTSNAGRAKIMSDRSTKRSQE